MLDDGVNQVSLEELTSKRGAMDVTSASANDSSSSGTETPKDHTPMLPPPNSPLSRDQVQKRIESLTQQNRVLKCELETYKLRVKSLQEENRCLRQASVHIQAKAEQEEEFISNTLLKKIQALKKEKENLALNYEQEEECLTNDLSRKLDQLRQEKVQLEHTLEQEQECLVNKLMRRIEKLETETTSKQTSLETLRREKVELENTLEQEQEALVNKLWKRMDQLETEKRSLQVRLDKPVSEMESPKMLCDFNSCQGNGADTAANLANNIRALRQECARLKQQLALGKQEHEKKMAAYAKEEKEIREENLRLQRRLQLEVERREALCRHLSESESSLEMEEERVYNEMSSSMHNNPVVAGLPPAAAPSGAPPVVATTHRGSRTLSSPIPFGMVGSAAVTSGSVPPPSISRPLSPGLNYGEQKPGFTPPRLHHAGVVVGVPSPSPPPPTASRRSHPGAPSPAAGGFARPGNNFGHPSFLHQTTHLQASSPAAVPAAALVERHITTDDEKPPASPMDVSGTSLINNAQHGGDPKPSPKVSCEMNGGKV